MMQRNVSTIRVAFVIYLLEQLKIEVQEYVTRESLAEFMDKVEENLKLSATHLERLYDSYESAFGEEELEEERLSKVKRSTILKLMSICKVPYKNIRQFEISTNYQEKDTFKYITFAKKYLKAYKIKKISINNLVKNAFNKITDLNKVIDLSTISSRNTKYIGRWEGVSIEEWGEYNTAIDIITSKNKDIIFGTASVLYHDIPEISSQENLYKLQGKIIDTLNYINFEFQNTNKKKKNFGYLLLKLSKDRKRLEGEFIAHGFISGEIVTGKIKLRKIN